ncbi:MAG: GTPase required for pre-60S ribosomal subunit nuclear export and maturation [Cirrosporium novae-zelandiae]|nr:MAG: GTPase required for pre-60S ribosomal subunit nuclear export and maturation [Cirrosporium novae-zelandiae]
MGTGKKEAARKVRQGKVGDGMANVKVKGENFYRNAKKIKTLNMFKDGRPQRNADGFITKAASYQSRDKPVARVEPNRKWFGNTRVISQDSLSAFRDAMAEKESDPYQVLLKSNKLPMSLIRDGQGPNGLKEHQAKIAIQSSSFKDTFGPKAQRKRVKLNVATLEDLAGETDKMQDEYHERLEQAALLKGASAETADMDIDDEGHIATAREPVFSKGQSKRIWNELYKVIDSSDVIVHVLDARDPIGTRCRSVESYMKNEAPHKHLIFCMNKCDLVPTGVAASWVRALSKEYPTLAFRSSINNSFGLKGLFNSATTSIFFATQRPTLLYDSSTFLFLPGLTSLLANTGKSSIINTLRNKKVCTVAPIPGETKIWQYITLMKRIYLIDCPGIVPPSSTDTEEDLLLRGVVRTEKVFHPAQYIPAILNKSKPHYIKKTYDLKDFSDANDFLNILAKKGGRLLKGGEADVDSVARMVIDDFLRGKIPWYTPPPSVEGKEAVAIEGRAGRLGEMSKKRKREEVDLQGKDGEDSHEDLPDPNEEDDNEVDEFAGFSDKDDTTQIIDTGDIQAELELKGQQANSDGSSDEPGGE